MEDNKGVFMGGAGGLEWEEEEEGWRGLCVGGVWGGCGHRKRCIMSRRDIPYPWPLLFVQDVTAIYICDPQQTDQ